MTDLDRAVLDFEQAWPHGRRGKDAAALDQLGLSPTGYAQRLNALLDDPDAYVYAPVTVKRLRRLRETRRAARPA